jgi:hypothetical protein
MLRWKLSYMGPLQEKAQMVTLPNSEAPDSEGKVDE